MSQHTQAVINLKALEANVRICQSAAPNSGLMAVVKADAYGHGMIQVARQLAAPGKGVAAFAVAHVDEGVQLRESGIEQPIVVLSDVCDVNQLLDIVNHRLSIVVYHEHQLRLLESNSAVGSISVWIKVDTGMHRLGFLVDEVPAVYQRLENCPNVQASIRLMSHFANADQPDDATNRQQIELFQSIPLPAYVERSMANSAALFAQPDSHFDWVRPGISLYGASPFCRETSLLPVLRPVMTLRSKVIAVYAFQRGDRLGYGGDGVCQRNTVVAVVGIGYGDGYPRHLPQGTPVVVGGQTAPLIGRVSMDTIMIDITGCVEVGIGSDVVLWGDALPVEHIASAAGTISYELLAQVSSRVRYVYVEE